ncbi:hypothetical protein COCOBI_03-0780 [Coccomyxa sp. Obi]|nr:hypothetical protein COCOBI_03-0780 [Coccomyxa sp. Obi]
MDGSLRDGPSIVIIPSINHKDCHRPRCAGGLNDEQTDRQYQCQSRTPCQGDSCSRSRNYLMAGGKRAFDRQNEQALLNVSASTIKDLQKANNVLARELVLAHSRAKESIGFLQQQLADATARQEKEHQHAGRLKQAEEQHKQEILDLQHKLATERTARTAAEGSLRELKRRARVWKKRLQEDLALRKDAAESADATASVASGKLNAFPCPSQITIITHMTNAVKPCSLRLPWT